MIAAVTTESSVRRQPKYEYGRRLYSVSVDNLPGLQDEIVELPNALIEALRALLGESAEPFLQINGTIDSWSSTSIQTAPGFFVAADAVYFLEPLTLTPTVGSFWGHYEIRLLPIENGDPVVADLWDGATNTPLTAISNTKRLYRVSVQENFSATAAFEPDSADYVRWIEYKRSGAGGPIVEVNLALSPAIRLNAAGQLLLREEPTNDASATTKSYVDERSGVLGLYYGGLEKSGNNPPSIRPGTYEIDGIYLKYASRRDLNWIIHNLGDSAPTNDCHFGVFEQQDGTVLVHIMYGDPIALSIPIQAIVDAGGGNWDLHVANAVDLTSLFVGAIAATYGTPVAGNSGTLDILAFSNTNDSAAPGRKFVRVKNARGAAQAAAAGNVNLHFRVNSEASVANTALHTPLLSPDLARNGFYSEYLALQSRVARCHGIFYVSPSGVVEEDRVFSVGRGVEWGNVEGKPVSEIFSIAASNAPAGAFECDGRAISRTQFARLFGRIGTRYGAGNGATTFNVPDLRGEFIRGWDNGRGIDAGRAIGSFQIDTQQGHRHEPLGGGNFAVSTAGTFAFQTIQTISPGSFVATTGDPVSDGTNGTPRTSSETRPRNVALMYCIKY